jgi:hypothetical protein
LITNYKCKEGNRSLPRQAGSTDLLQPERLVSARQRDIPVRARRLDSPSLLEQGKAHRLDIQVEPGTFYQDKRLDSESDISSLSAG